ncbi:MAG: DUF5702 domain-containing protein [Clostridiales Family XIII bacterium]|jgi:hypothetical protein|nr:DUF5702 domain-containing protein [Clostridiales Family XIII bacterium]
MKSREGTAKGPARGSGAPTAQAAPRAVCAMRSVCALKSRRGSSAVFLVMILSAMLLLAGTLIGAAGLTAGKSCGDLAFRMAGRSLLAEYDRRLYADYGLFAMRSNETEAARKLTHYVDAALKNGGRAGAVWLIPFDVKDLRVHLSDFSLIDADTFEKQILDDIKFIMLNKLADKLRPAADANGTEAANPRTINNQAVLNSLPSKGLGGGGPSVFSMLASGLPSAGDLLSGGTDSFFVSEYIMARFAHAYEAVPNLAAGHARFFQNEVEYVLIGGRDDAENLKAVEGRLRLLRFALNEVCVHGNAELSSRVDMLVAALAAVLEGVPPPILKELVLAAWVALETENDLKLLRTGRKVALIKNTANWAVGIDKVPAVIGSYFKSAASDEDMPPDISETSENASRFTEAVEPSDKSGFSYGEYLRIFLFFASRENKLLRSMDLIQINMKTGYYESFLIREHYTGLRFDFVMNGDRCAYRQSYDAPDGQAERRS